MRPSSVLRFLSLLVLTVAWSPRPSVAWPLQCQLRAQRSGAVPPVDVQFEALVAGGTEPFGFHWDFGDGATSTLQSPSHTYTSAGMYQVVMTVTGVGASEEVCRDTVVVPVGYAIDPICQAAADTRWGEAPLEVQLDAWPIFVGDPGPYTWTWSFGDGSTSADQHPLHAYADVGTYWTMVTLHTSSHDYPCWPLPIRVSAIPPTAAVGPHPDARPEALRLEPGRPNPFGPMTTLAFELPRTGPVRLQIVDAAGRIVTTLVDGSLPAGRHARLWQGVTSAGARAPTGLYFARLEFENEVRHTAIVRLH